MKYLFASKEEQETPGYATGNARREENPQSPSLTAEILFLGDGTAEVTRT
jgi:hypothetical protein